MAKTTFEAEYGSVGCGLRGTNPEAPYLVCIGGTITTGLAAAVGRRVELAMTPEAAERLAGKLLEYAATARQYTERMRAGVAAGVAADLARAAARPDPDYAGL